MASNRVARRTLAYGKSPATYRISNRRVMCHSSNWPFVWTSLIKRSRKHSLKGE